VTGLNFDFNVKFLLPLDSHAAAIGVCGVKIQTKRLHMTAAQSSNPD